MLLSYIFGPSVVKYDILSNNRRSKLHAVIDCPFSLFDSKRKRFIIRGDWTDRIQCFAVDKFNKKDFKRESKRRRSDGASEADAKDSTSAASLESFSSGSSDGSATVDTSAAKDLWRFQERPPNSKQVDLPESHWGGERMVPVLANTGMIGLPQ